MWVWVGKQIQTGNLLQKRINIGSKVRERSTVGNRVQKPLGAVAKKYKQKSDNYSEVHCCRRILMFVFLGPRTCNKKLCILV